MLKTSLSCQGIVLQLLLLLWTTPWLQILANDEGCNEFVCGSVVSKCLLTQSCQCKLNDCYCCKDCLNCLGDLYTECCSCLDMCPKHNTTLSALTPRSEIGDIDGVPELFDILTAEDDEEQWTTLRFPMRVGLKRRGGAPPGGGDSIQGFSIAAGAVDGRGDAIERQASAQKSSVNCTVIYLNSCVRSSKCKQHCESMGSNSYRWFHDGCCECIGANCLNYGINESRCRACPEEEPEPGAIRVDEVEEEFKRTLNFEDTDPDALDDDEDDMWDYGENEMNYS